MATINFTVAKISDVSKDKALNDLGSNSIKLVSKQMATYINPLGLKTTMPVSRVYYMFSDEKPKLGSVHALDIDALTVVERPYMLDDTEIMLKCILLNHHTCEAVDVVDLAVDIEKPSKKK